jgi:CxxC motif-containing protein (DUF1111 family)
MSLPLRWSSVRHHNAIGDKARHHKGRDAPEAMIARRIALAITASALSLICAADNGVDALSAGSFTVQRADADAYLQPGTALSERQRETFARGQATFNRRWVVPGLSTGDWGVGPTFVADRCSACHVRAGRGAPPDNASRQPVSTVLRLSLPGADMHGGPLAHPHYGDQIQNRALQGQTLDLVPAYEPVSAEADVYLEWEDQPVILGDGTEVRLRRPRPLIETPAFGDLGADTLMSLRNAPPIFGLGLLEAVPEEVLLAIAERQRTLGFAGRPNRVWNEADQRHTLGRFGWKANQPGLRQQVAAAAIGDMGVTSTLFPRQNCPDIQAACRREPPGNEPELTDTALDELEIWALGLGVPAQRNRDTPEVQRGAALFDKLQCAVCHVPTLTTADYFARLPQLSGQTIHPYTDLLLHDMGPDLADDRPDFAAGGRDWRTPPLWGLGLSRTVNGSTALLHDGRARNVTEAILWHGGEAQTSRDAFRQLSRRDREDLLAFIDAL